MMSLWFKVQGRGSGRRVLTIIMLPTDVHPASRRGRAFFSLLAVAILALPASASLQQSGAERGMPAAAGIQKGGEEETGPYDVVDKWPQPWAKSGYIWGSLPGIFAESPDRIYIAARGE